MPIVPIMPWKAFTTLATIVWSIALVILVACSSGSGSLGGGEACAVDTKCAADSDCANGQHCNTAVSPPQCYKLYCAAAGTPCTESAICAQPNVCRSYSDGGVYVKSCGCIANGNGCHASSECCAAACKIINGAGDGACGG